MFGEAVVYGAGLVVGGAAALAILVTLLALLGAVVKKAGK